MVGMFLLGLHFFLLDYGYDPGDIEWLVFLSLSMYTLMCFGLTPVPSTILSEIFPSDLKSIAGCVGSIASALFAFVASRTYQPLVDLISEKYVFWIYATIIMISLIYSLTMVPETKGKTLQVIDHILYIVMRHNKSYFQHKYYMLIMLLMLIGNSRYDDREKCHWKVTTRDTRWNWKYSSVANFLTLLKYRIIII